MRAYIWIWHPRPGHVPATALHLKEKAQHAGYKASKQALAHHLAWGTCPAQSHSNLTYTNAGGISEYLLFAPLVRRPGAPRLAARQRPQITCRTRSPSGEICMSM